jgi:hypothetical protein
LRAAKADEQVYAKAACRVSRYVDAGGGPQAVLTLIDALNHGMKRNLLRDYRR